MGEEDSNDRENDRSRGFRFGIRVGLLSDLLGDLAEVNISDSPTPNAESIEWNTVNETIRRDQLGDQGLDRTDRELVSTPTADCLLDTRFEDDEFVVLADIPGATLEALTVGVDPTDGTLVIAREDNILARVPLPWDPVEVTTSSYNNGILEVRVRSLSG